MHESRYQNPHHSDQVMTRHCTSIEGGATISINPTDTALPTELESLFAGLFGGMGPALPTQTIDIAGTESVDNILDAIFPLGGSPPTGAATPTETPENFFSQLAEIAFSTGMVQVVAWF